MFVFVMEQHFFYIFWAKFAVFCRRCKYAVTCRLYGPRLVNVYMSRIGRNSPFVWSQSSRYENGVGGCSADEKVNVSV